MNSRYIHIDIVRTIAVLASLMIHLRTTLVEEFFFGLASIGISSVFFKMGIVFVFVMGMMSQHVYLPRWKNHITAMDIKLIKKGLGLVGIYLMYCLVYVVVYQAQVSFSWMFRENAVMIGIFLDLGIFYLLLPILFRLLSNLRKFWLGIIGLGLILVGIFVSYSFNTPSYWLNEFFVIANNWYALVPLLGVLILGMWFGSWHFEVKLTIESWLGLFSLWLSFILLIFILNIYQHTDIWVYLLQVAALGLLLLLLRPINTLFLQLSQFWEKLVSLILLPGSQSFMFFLVGNIVIDILRWFSRSYEIELATNNQILLVLGIAYFASLPGFRKQFSRL